MELKATKTWHQSKAYNSKGVVINPDYEYDLEGLNHDELSVIVIGLAMIDHTACLRHSDQALAKLLLRKMKEATTGS